MSGVSRGADQSVGEPSSNLPRNDEPIDAEDNPAVIDQKVRSDADTEQRDHGFAHVVADEQCE